MWRSVFLAALFAVGFGFMVGGLMDIDGHDTGVLDALNYAVQAHNSRSNDMYVRQVTEVIRAQAQYNIPYCTWLSVYRPAAVPDAGMTSKRAPRPVGAYLRVMPADGQPLRYGEAVVAGVKYIITVKMARTSCRKGSNNEVCSTHTDPQLAQQYQCTFTVWSRPWLNDTRVLEDKCE